MSVFSALEMFRSQSTTGTFLQKGCFFYWAVFLFSFVAHVGISEILFIIGICLKTVGIFESTDTVGAEGTGLAGLLMCPVNGSKLGVYPCDVSAVGYGGRTLLKANPTAMERTRQSPKPGL